MTDIVPDSPFFSKLQLFSHQHLVKRLVYSVRVFKVGLVQHQPLSPLVEFFTIQERKIDEKKLLLVESWVLFETCIFSKIQFTKRFIRFVFVETNQLFSSHPID